MASQEDQARDQAQEGRGQAHRAHRPCSYPYPKYTAIPLQDFQQVRRMKQSHFHFKKIILVELRRTDQRVYVKSTQEAMSVKGKGGGGNDGHIRKLSKMLNQWNKGLDW